MYYPKPPEALLKYGSKNIIEKLTPYLTEERCQRIEKLLDNKIDSISIAVEAPCDIHNATAIVRTSEALGISNVDIVEWEGKQKISSMITRGAQKWTNVNFIKEWDSFIDKIRNDPSKPILIGACVERGTPLEEIPLDRPICILLGNENRGLSQRAKEQCDKLYNIPMYGMTESFNLSVAAAMTLYSITNRKRVLMKKNSDLSQLKREELKAEYYFKSLGTRIAYSCLKST